MAEFRKTVTLSDGRIASIRRSKGGDLIHAQEIGESNRMKFTCALLARITEIDGRPVVFEDIKELYSSDIDRLSAEASGDFLSSTESSSPASSNGVLPSQS